MGKAVYSEAQIRDYVNPLIKRVSALSDRTQTKIIGVCGGLGTGKSTLSAFLRDSLREKGYSVDNFSIDDFITSYDHRRRLAQQNEGSPFYQIYRAMPGTHRVNDLKRTLEDIREGRDFELPIFDKSLKGGWGDISQDTRKVSGRQDFVIFEGWLVGTPVITSEELKKACDKYGANLDALDPTLKYSKVLLSSLREYQQLWSFLDHLAMLQADSKDSHHEWRNQAEITKAGSNARKKEEVSKYVDVFMPLICAAYEYTQPDVTIKKNRDHQFIGKVEKEN